MCVLCVIVSKRSHGVVSAGPCPPNTGMGTVALSNPATLPTLHSLDRAHVLSFKTRMSEVSHTSMRPVIHPHSSQAPRCASAPAHMAPAQSPQAGTTSAATFWTTAACCTTWT
jgi:hypothetical protein